MNKWVVNSAGASILDPGDRGLAYGDGLFETIAVRNSACRFLDEHLTRLLTGCRQLHIPPPDSVQLVTSIDELIRTECCTNGVIKIIVTRGNGPRGYAFDPTTSEATVAIGVTSAEPYIPSAEGVSVRDCTTTVSRNNALAGIKTLNRLPQVMARAEWQDDHFAEGLMSDDRGNLISGTMSNLFIVRDNEIWTPPVTEAGIAGVMRGKILESAETMNIKVTQRYFSKPDINGACEVFLSNSLIGIWPVKQFEEHSFNVGPVTRLIMAALAKQGVTECLL
jgi:4-amino-4-deoxychorismate lyase